MWFRADPALHVVCRCCLACQPTQRRPARVSRQIRPGERYGYMRAQRPNGRADCRSNSGTYSPTNRRGDNRSNYWPNSRAGNGSDCSSGNRSSNSSSRSSGNLPDCGSDYPWNSRPCYRSGNWPGGRWNCRPGKPADNRSNRGLNCRTRTRANYWANLWSNYGANDPRTRSS